MAKNNEGPKVTVRTTYVDKIKGFEDRKAMVTIAPITVAPKPTTAPTTGTAKGTITGTIMNSEKDTKK